MSKPEQRPQRFSLKADDVLRRMLRTPPKPHVAPKKKPKKPAK